MYKHTFLGVPPRPRAIRKPIPQPQCVMRVRQMYKPNVVSTRKRFIWKLHSTWTPNCARPSSLMGRRPAPSLHEHNSSRARLCRAWAKGQLSRGAAVGANLVKFTSRGARVAPGGHDASILLFCQWGTRQRLRINLSRFLPVRFYIRSVKGFREVRQCRIVLGSFLCCSLHYGAVPRLHKVSTTIRVKGPLPAVCNREWARITTQLRLEAPKLKSSLIRGWFWVSALITMRQLARFAVQRKLTPKR